MIFKKSIYYVGRAGDLHGSNHILFRTRMNPVWTMTKINSILRQQVEDRDWVWATYTQNDIKRYWEGTSSQ